MEDFAKRVGDALRRVVGEAHVLIGEAARGFGVDWTGAFVGTPALVVRPGSTSEVAAVLRTCGELSAPVVLQGGNTGLVGGGVPLDGEVVCSLTRLRTEGVVDPASRQVTVGAGVSLARISDIAAPYGLDLGIHIASRESATVGGAVATNAGGLRVLRYGAMREQVRGVEAVLSSGEIISHLSGLRKDNTGYDYASLLAGSEGTLAAITQVRLGLVPRIQESTTCLVACADLEELHALALGVERSCPRLISAEYFAADALAELCACTGMQLPLHDLAPSAALLLVEVEGDASELDEIVGNRVAAVCALAERSKLWRYRERMPELAGYLGTPLKLDVSVPAAQWVQLATEAAGAVRACDPGARTVCFGHILDGNVHVNIVPASARDGRHQEAVFALVAALGGSISAEHGVGRLKASWLHLSRTRAELDLFADIRAAFDPAGILNPGVLPRRGDARSH